MSKKLAPHPELAEPRHATWDGHRPCASVLYEPWPQPDGWVYVASGDWTGVSCEECLAELRAGWKPPALIEPGTPATRKAAALPPADDVVDADF